MAKEIIKEIPAGAVLVIGTKAIFAKPARGVKQGVEMDGYDVYYEQLDGSGYYASWSPADQFEAAYRDTTGGMMDFGSALFLLKMGKRVARKGWNGKGMWILMQVPCELSKMTHPYLYIEYPDGHPAYPNGSRVPWLASQTDMLADDWMVID